MLNRDRARRALALAVTATTLLALSAMVTGCLSSDESAPGTDGTQAPASVSTATPVAGQPKRAEVQAFVDEAVAYSKASGKDAALKAFTDPGGEFHKGELYIYAYDFNGTVIAHGGDPTLVGRNLIDMKDANGVRVIAELVRLAKTGSGWLNYVWPNPANGNKQEPKLGYVAKVDDTWFLGSGTYGPAAVQP
jgi:cytochrome c